MAGRRVATRSASTGEHQFLEGLRDIGKGAAGVVVGIGDDAAVVRCGPRTVLTTDTMMEGVHFRLGWLTPRELGVRAFRAALSDVAAMGARPLYVLLSLEVPHEKRRRGFDEAFAGAVVRGVAADARGVGAALVGGNISAASGWGLTTTVIGDARHPAVTRDAAAAGDVVFVTGALGGSAAGVRALQKSGARAAGAHTIAYRKPPLRVELAVALAEARLLHAMIDVSDGLVQDLGHLCRRSGVRIDIDSDAVPVHRIARAVTADRESALRMALAGGEDYELAFTATPRRRAAIEEIARRHPCAITAIGTVAKGRAVVTDMRGRDLRGGGFDHFRRRV